MIMKRKIDFKKEAAVVPSKWTEILNQTANQLHSGRIDSIYHSIVRSTGALGGNGNNGPIYGELTKHSMQKILELMVTHMDLDPTSRFLDVGSGLGKPNIHACQYPGVSLSIGVEIEEIRWQLAMVNLAMLCIKTCNAPRVHGVNIIKGDIASAKSLDPFTHIYMFDIGFPPKLLKKLATMVNKSAHVRYVVSYQRPNKIIGEYGFCVDLILQEAARMQGSGEMHTAYFYRRKSRSFATYSETIRYDPFFKDAIDIAIGNKEQFHRNCVSSADSFLHTNAKRQCC